MRNSQTYNPQIRHEHLALVIRRKPQNYLDFLMRYYDEVAHVISPFIKYRISSSKSMFQVSQIYEALKNAAAHGGDALFALRLYFAYRNGERKKIIEAVVWDNGPGISNLQQVLINGFSTTAKRLRSDYHGMGKGLDILIGDSPRRYVADEFILESGQQKTSRQHQHDLHHLHKSRRFTHGTKITLRFWL